MFTEDSLERMKYAVKCDYDWKHYQVFTARDEAEGICDFFNLSISEMKQILDDYNY